MLKKLGTSSLTLRLALSYSVIVSMFLGTILYVNHTFRQVEALYSYSIGNVMYRTELLLVFHREFREFHRLVQLLHFAQQQPELNEYAPRSDAALSAVYETLQQLAAYYRVSAIQDSGTDESEILIRVDIMHNIMQYIGYIFEYFSTSANAQNPRYPLTIPQLAELAEQQLQQLIEMAEGGSQEAISLINNTLNASRSITLVTSFIILAMIIFVGIYTTNSFAKNLRYQRHRIAKIAEGDFKSLEDENNKDEISILISEIAGNFRGLIDSINKISTQGGQYARIAADSFQGIYKDTADSINSLLNDITNERAANEYMQLLIDHVPVVMTLWDKQFKMLDCNDEAARRYKLSGKEEYKRRFNEISPEYQPDGSKSVQRARELITQSFETGFGQFEWLHQDINGEPIPSEIICYTYEHDNETLMFSYAIDLRELKNSMEQAVQDKYKASIAEENSMAKSRFLAKMSHEIRTPITAVLGIAEINLQKTDLPLGLEEAFAKIHNSANILLGIVNDILDLSKIEAGKMELVIAKYETASLVNDIVQMNIIYLGSKKIDFTIEIDERLPSYLMGDELRLKQIITNILSNAFKYTEKGQISLSVRCNRLPGDAMIELDITVRDTGLGMTPQQIESVFDEYARFHENEQRFVQGSGLGMPIARNLLKMMDASIDVNSSVGLGTVVRLMIPQGVASKIALGAETARNIESFRESNLRRKLSFIPKPMPYGNVLVVDDVDSNLYVAKGLMAMYELQIETRSSGIEAIELISQGKSYDIIFMDHMMPEMDGIEATKRLREMGYTRPIVAFTANALVGQAEEFIKNGFDGFISKPISTVHLDALLNRFVKGEPSIKDTVDIPPPPLEEYAGQTFDVSMLDPDLLYQIHQEFIETQADTHTQVLQALSVNDIKQAHFLAHTLKGLAGLLAEEGLVNACQALENTLKAEEYPTQEQLNSLDIELKRVLNQLG